MSRSRNGHEQKQLFKTRLVPGKEGSGKLFEEEFKTPRHRFSLSPLHKMEANNGN
jgi:hypothetical protein